LSLNQPEVVEVEHGDRQRAHGAIGLGDHAAERVVDAAAIREAGERVGGGPALRDGEVAQVREHGSGLGHGLVQPPVGLVAQIVGVGEQDGADHLAADQERLAARRAVQVPADRAGEHLAVLVLVAVEAPAEPHRHARAGLRHAKGLGQRMPGPRAAAPSRACRRCCSG
jgi:hypothetical protein